MKLMEHELLRLLVVVFGVSALVVFLLNKLKIPSVVGFLAAGAIIGPYGAGLIKDTRAVEVMAEIGVILLLFAIGIEFSLTRLGRMKRAVLAGGGAQMVLTIAVAATAAYYATGDAGRSVFFGFLIALSSTAIVLKMLAEKGETDSPHGRVMVGILLFQDLCVVPLMLLIPSLSGQGVHASDLAVEMGKATLIIAAVLLSARWVVPGLLHQVVSTRSRELFIITIMLVCLGIALLTSRLGLSLSLGAFLAGLVISESEYAHQATSDILPFKESFIGLFFVSVGMLMDIGYMSSHCLQIAAAVALIFALKIVTGSVSALAAGSPLRASVHAGLGLAQVGEFSFVLALAGKEAGIITEGFYQVFLSSSVVTMILTPFVLNGAPSMAAWVTSGPMMRRLENLRKGSAREGFPRKREGHVIIIGFGLNGRNVAKVLKEAGIPYFVLEINSETVQEMKKRGEPIYYGDGSSQEILRKLGAERARLLVVAISDPASTRRVVSLARKENPGLHIVVRTRYLAEVDDLKSLGADEVIPEEFETSIEIFSRVLQHYNFPANVVEDVVEKIRSDNYTALRIRGSSPGHLFEKVQWIPEMEINGFRVREGAHLAGKSIGELQIRKKTGVTVIAVRRGPEVITAPSPDFTFHNGDIILFTGDRESMNRAVRYFKSGMADQR